MTIMKQDVEKISVGLTRLLDEIEAVLQATAGSAETNMDHAGRKSRETLKRIGGHLRNAKSELLEGAHKIDEAVHSHSWRILAATAIVSFVAGLLVRRR